MPSVNSKAHQENKIKLKIVRRTRESFPLAFVRSMFVKWISLLENIRGSKIRYIICIGSLKFFRGMGNGSGFA